MNNVQNANGLSLAPVEVVATTTARRLTFQPSRWASSAKDASIPAQTPILAKQTGPNRWTLYASIDLAHDYIYLDALEGVDVTFTESEPRSESLIPTWASHTRVAALEDLVIANTALGVCRQKPEVPGEPQGTLTVEVETTLEVVSGDKGPLIMPPLPAWVSVSSSQDQFLCFTPRDARALARLLTEAAAVIEESEATNDQGASA